MLALELGDTGTAQVLLKQKARIDLTDQKGRNALWYAARYCRIELADQLLNATSAQLNFADRDGYTALHVAASKRCAPVVTRLLTAGADIEAQTRQHNTPLMLAIRSDETDIARELIGHGAQANAQNNNGDTALIYAVSVGSRELVTSLLEHGSDPYRRNELGESALALAELHHPELVDLIKEKTGFHIPGF